MAAPRSRRSIAVTRFTTRPGPPGLSSTTAQSSLIPATVPPSASISILAAPSPTGPKGAITGQYAGIPITGGAATVVNLGEITEFQFFRRLSAFWRQFNHWPERIARRADHRAVQGRQDFGTTGTVANFETIIGTTGNGVFLAAGGSVASGQSGFSAGLISGTSYGIAKESQGFEPNHRRRERQRRSKPIVAALAAWADETVLSLSRKSELAALSRYMRALWRRSFAASMMSVWPSITILPSERFAVLRSTARTTSSPSPTPAAVAPRPASSPNAYLHATPVGGQIRQRDRARCRAGHDRPRGADADVAGFVAAGGRRGDDVACCRLGTADPISLRVASTQPDVGSSAADRLDAGLCWPSEHLRSALEAAILAVAPGKNHGAGLAHQRCANCGVGDNGAANERIVADRTHHVPTPQPVDMSSKFL